MDLKDWNMWYETTGELKNDEIKIEMAVYGTVLCHE